MCNPVNSADFEQPCVVIERWRFYAGTDEQGVGMLGWRHQTDGPMLCVDCIARLVAGLSGQAAPLALDPEICDLIVLSTTLLRGM
jgi:hypothetical protein